MGELSWVNQLQRSLFPIPAKPWTDSGARTHGYKHITLLYLVLRFTAPVRTKFRPGQSPRSVVLCDTSMTGYNLCESM